MPGAKVSFDGKYLILTVSESCDPANKLYIASLDGFDGSAKSLKLTRIVECDFLCPAFLPCDISSY